MTITKTLTPNADGTYTESPWHDVVPAPAPPPPPPPPTGALLGVKHWSDLPAPYPPIPASALSAINATSQVYVVITPTAPSSVAHGVAELETGTAYGAAALNYTGNAACAVGVTGGSGGWYLIGNEPEDFNSDNTDPGLFATEMHSWVQAIRAIDPAAHFVGPNLTSWTSLPSGLTPSTYPWGPPIQWFASMVSSYKSQYGTNPPFDRLAVHAYVLPDMTTAFMYQPVPYLPMIDQFSAAAVSYGYPSKIWVTEGGVLFPQPASQALSSSQQTAVTNYMHGLLHDPNVERAYYFQGDAPGWNPGSNSVRSPFDTSWNPTDVGTALKAATQ